MYWEISLNFQINNDYLLTYLFTGTHIISSEILVYLLFFIQKLRQVNFDLSIVQVIWTMITQFIISNVRSYNIRSIIEWIAVFK